MSTTEKYQPFFTKLLEEVEKKRPGLTEFNAQQKKNWVKICTVGQPYFHFSCSFSKDGFHVNLTFQSKNGQENKAAFDALEKDKKEIEKNIGFPLKWHRSKGKRAKRADIYALRPECQIIDSASELEGCREWAVNTILKFDDILKPKISAYIDSTHTVQ